jgi:hypothetical protein
MHTRHVATAVLGLTLVLGACGSGTSGSKASTGTPSSTVPVTSAVTAAQGGAGPTVRTDDLEADLRSVDRDLGGAQQSVNQANDTSPDQADD